jgi:uncharacterized protein
MRSPLWVGRPAASIAILVAVGRMTVSIERESGEVLCQRCVVADTSFSRLKGLLGRKALADSEGLLIRPAGSIHTLFMRMPIDVVFLDREHKVVKVVGRLHPWRVAAARGASRVLELGEGTCARAALAVGERLELVPGVPKAQA